MKWTNIDIGNGRVPSVIQGLGWVMGVLAVLLMVSPSWSAGFTSPDECLAYSGDAHLNCLYAYIEIQQDKISKLEKKLEGQQRTNRELRGRLRQENIRAKTLQRKIKDQKVGRSGHRDQFRSSHAGFYYRFGGPYYYDPYLGSAFGYSYGWYYPWW